MFERFTGSARDAVTQARTEAADLGDVEVGTQHVLLGVLWNAEGAGKQLLDEIGLDYRTTRQRIADGVGQTFPDAEALRGIGIDLDEVRRRAEQAFGKGALNRRGGGREDGRPRFAQESKKTLELALREAIALRQNYLGTEHILLGLTRLPASSAGRLIAASGVTPDELGARLRQRLRKAA
ncbi:Clp protease N-terminal domain-containing protein [Microlunatus sp. Gsoil 973]|jgi:ATP-dependent Clp protease ATP-binding subunit ClpA|uniref:Clp protease N-terminal domain-containing protein n=1 Tax=Microlunatus sp. Gsoil 973 TaxID=2672569 RepID=UPI0018A809DC|nr:Clp protease N-terminal domain-containing protein [Microlunatus sp. Gsoil 973]